MIMIKGWWKEKHRLNKSNKLRTTHKKLKLNFKIDPRDIKMFLFGKLFLNSLQTKRTKWKHKLCSSCSYMCTCIQHIKYTYLIHIFQWYWTFCCCCSHEQKKSTITGFYNYAKLKRVFVISWQCGWVVVGW